MAAEGKVPTLAEEYSLPPKEVSVEKSATSTVAEVVPQKDTETSPADETAAAVEEKSETPEVKEPEAEETVPAAEESDEAPEETEEKPEIVIETAPADFRFPTTNQTRHCFTRYVEYHRYGPALSPLGNGKSLVYLDHGQELLFCDRCVAAKGDDAPECEKFAKYYRSLCPSEWVERWNEQRENGTFPGPL
uniref:Cytochrome c oxidase subunit 6b-1 n=1 Tax=Aegilops tauschii subsp. strangulata TaxID=200361 RepID=A0A453B262_AEGTS